jgi:ribonuclease HI
LLKVNTDGAYFAETKIGATGVIIRRKDGSFLTAMARRLPSVASVLVAEACWDGLKHYRKQTNISRFADAHKLHTSVFELRDVFSNMNISLEERKKNQGTNDCFL